MLITVFETSDMEIRKNVLNIHEDLMSFRGYAEAENEIKAIKLSNAVQSYYYNVVGFSSSDLWKKIDSAINVFFEEEYLLVW